MTAAEKYHEKFNNLPGGLEWNEVQEILRPYELAMDIERRKKTRTEEPEYKDIPDYGDHMSMEDFVGCCECGGFIDYDGHGYYATKDKTTSITIYPSDIMDNKYRKDFTHVVWFNK